MSDDLGNKPPKFDLDEYLSATAYKLVQDIYKVADAEKKYLGETFYKELVLSVVTSTIATLIYRSLGNKDEYLQIKKAIESSVESAFIGGHSTLGETSVDNLDFLCQVKDVGTPANKVPA